MREYLLPTGLVSGPLAATLVATQQAWPLANHAIAFTNAYGTQWSEDGLQSHFFDTLALQQLAQNHANLLQKFSAPRGAFAGLSLDKPIIMGILNATPDSFSDGGDYANLDAVIARAQTMLDEGAQIIDVGGESTRPGALPPEVEEEIRRVVPVIRAIADLVNARGAKISIDTRRVMVMEAAMGAGAHIVNDVSALEDDPLALDFIHRTGTPVILTHKQGEPVTMQNNPHYEHAALEVYDYLFNRVQLCLERGLQPADIVIDPGIGFGKSLQHNLDIMQQLALYQGLGVGVMLGISRKGITGTLTGVVEYKNRTIGSVAAAQYALSEGVQLLRVHDVAATKEMVDLWLGLQSNAAE